MKIENFSSEHSFVYDLQGSIASPIFERRATGFITAFNTHDQENDDLVAAIASDTNHGPDGAIFWMPNGYKNAFFAFAVEYMRDAYKQDRLNFGNGFVCETLLFQDFDAGTLVEMIDPECGTFLFEEMVNAFMLQHQLSFSSDNNLTQFMYYEDCHLDSNWKRECPSTELIELLKPYER